MAVIGKGLEWKSIAMSLAAGGVAVGLLLAGGIPAAHAAPLLGNEAAFQAFVHAMKVDSVTEAALIKKFDELSTAEQSRIVSSAKKDPISVLEFEPEAEPTVVPHPHSVGENEVTYEASSRTTVSLLGTTTGTFSLRYVFVATSDAVIRNLECSPDFSGFIGQWYIHSVWTRRISDGVGTCFSENYLKYSYEGASGTANKGQGLSFRGLTLKDHWFKDIPPEAALNKG